MARGQDSSWTVTDDPTSFLLDGWQDDATHRKADLLSAAEQKEAAERMLALEDFTARLGKLLGANPNLLPEVTLRYSGLTVVADALVGSQSLPSVRNSSLGMLKMIACQGSLSSKPVTLLDGVSGVLRPGRLTLLLGPPGAGKSLLMSVLGGRTRQTKTLRISGRVTFNGVEPSEFAVQRTVGLVSQQDLLIPNLTVQETVDFAAACLLPKSRRHWLSAEVAAAGAAVAKGKPADLEQDLEVQGMSDAEFAVAARKLAASGGKSQAVMGVLGLLHCAHTPVGGPLARGVSGGERRRVAAAEVLVGPQSVVLADQISTGLDSATTFTVVKFMGEAVRAMRKTCVVSLLQPPPEVMALFDDVILLTEGRVIYHGPVPDAGAWFQTLGFSRPARKDPCSFLQELTVPMGQALYATPALLAARGLPASHADPARLLEHPPADMVLPVPDMAAAFWKECASGAAMRADLDAQPAKFGGAWPVRGLYKRSYADRPMRLALNVWRRQRQLTKRMRAFYVSRMVQAVFMGVLRGSMFWMIPRTAAGGRLVLSCNTTTVVFLSMMSSPQVPMVFANKGVFIKQRNDRFFPSWSYALALFVTQIPQSLLESVLYSVAVYFMAGFYASPVYFFRFLVVTFIASNTLAALSRCIACAMPSRVVASATSSLLILINQITNGFNILQGDIPVYIKWLYYINPIAYGLSALNVNELTSPSWGAPDADDPSITLGQRVLDTYEMHSDPSWLWVCVGYLAGLLVVLTAATAVALRFTTLPGPQPTVADGEGGAGGEAPAKGAPGGDAELSKSLTAQLSRRRGAAAPAPAPAGAAAAAPVTVVCTHVTYCVPCPKGAAPSEDATKPGMLQLLRDITFTARPGRLTALMGGSGAGKTTLMDVVCGRKTTGHIGGEILVNGHPKVQASWARVMGYVEQENLHSPQLTVREALLFSARLRLPEDQYDLPAVERAVEGAMRITELGPLAGALTGVPGGVGLPMEALKRLSIAVELVANPSVLFMASPGPAYDDEPTTGLDARAAAIVVRALKGIAATNRTVMVTIHQPSMDVFESFDDLLLLKRGGRTMYFGPLGAESSQLVAYLTAFPGVPPLDPGYNPATWMLEVTGSTMSTVFKASDEDFAALYAASPVAAAVEADAAALAAEGAAACAPLALASHFATRATTRQRWLSWKFALVYWRSPNYNFVRIFMTLGVALLYGLVYFDEGKVDPSGTTVGTVQNVLGLLFSMAVFVGMFNAINVQNLMSADRAVFYRETAAGMYGPWAYASATGLAEVPYLVAQSLVMVCVAYWMVGFQPVAWKFFYFLLMFFQGLACYTYMGQCLVFCMPTVMMSLLLTTFLSQIWTIVNGYLIPYSQIPVYWQWLNRISPATWIIYGLGTSQLGDNDAPMDALDGTATTVSAFLASFFGYDYSFIWWAYVIVLAFTVVFMLGSALSLRYLNFNRR